MRRQKWARWKLSFELSYSKDNGEDRREEWKEKEGEKERGRKRGKRIDTIKSEHTDSTTDSQNIVRIKQKLRTLHVNSTN